MDAPSLGLEDALDGREEEVQRALESLRSQGEEEELEEEELEEEELEEE